MRRLTAGPRTAVLHLRRPKKRIATEEARLDAERFVQAALLLGFAGVLALIKASHDRINSRA